MPEIEPEFSKAFEQFRDFVAHCGHAGRLQWTFVEDYLWAEPRLYLREENLLQNEHLVQAIYGLGVVGFGVELSLVACTSDLSLCAIWTPATAYEAEDRWVSGLKMCVRKPPFEATMVSALEAQAVDRKVRRSQSPGPMAELISRSVWSAAVAASRKR